MKPKKKLKELSANVLKSKIILNITKGIIKQAQEEKIELDFDFEINPQELDSYKDIVYYKEQLDRLKLSIDEIFI